MCICRYWASAGKHVTMFMTGICVDEGYCDLAKPVSYYLGTGWTTLPQDKEVLITISDLLTMTSGLKEPNTFTDPLEYKVDAGTEWDYNKVYFKLHDIIAKTTGRSFDDYLQEKLLTPLSIEGGFRETPYLPIFFGTARSLAKLGILSLSHGLWVDKEIVSSNYLQEAFNSSQNLNPAYGYLTWLNGKSSYLLPNSTHSTAGSLITNAPDDLYFALGFYEQRLYIVPSQRLIVVRLGEGFEEGADTIRAVQGFDPIFWSYINAFTGYKKQPIDNKTC
jgi:CubicO group peptidase (beta-lactamase class C family)